MSEEPPAFLPDGEGANQAQETAFPGGQAGPTQEVVDATATHVNLAPENYVSADAKKAEVSEDPNFKFMNPNRARTLMLEKVNGPYAIKAIMERVEPQEQTYSGEHQRQHGWTKDRSGKTESGKTEVHIRSGEITSYVGERSPNYNEELYEHWDGVEVSVTYEPSPGNRRSLHWYVPDTAIYGTKKQTVKEVPEHITIYDSNADQPLVLTTWSTERRGPDQRFEQALQEMGTLLNERIVWSPPGESPPDPSGEMAVPHSPDRPSGGSLSQTPEISAQPSVSEAPPAGSVTPEQFADSVRHDIANLPETSEPNQNT